MIRCLILYITLVLPVLGNCGTIKPQVIAKYNALKILSGCNFMITSGWRSKAHNKAVGGVRNSYHLKGLAMDLIPLKTCNKSYKQLSRIASKLFNGVIRYIDHIHVDLGSRMYKKL